MDVKLFRQYVLAPLPMMVRTPPGLPYRARDDALLCLPQPPVLAECIFDALDSGGRGTVDLNDFLFGVAVLTRGSHEQRLRLLFNVYDVRRSGFIEA